MSINPCTGDNSQDRSLDPGGCRSARSVGQVRRAEGKRSGWQVGGENGCLLVEVLDAMDEATGIHGKRDAIQAAVAHHAGEAVGVVGLPGGPEDPLHDGLVAHVALLQSILRRERQLVNRAPRLQGVSQPSREGGWHHRSGKDAHRQVGSSRQQTHAFFYYYY